MNERRLAWVVASVGTMFLLASFHWDGLVETGLATNIDWLGAFSIAPYGSYYVAVGTAYLAGGLLLVVWMDHGAPPFRRRAVAVGAALAVVWTAVVVYWWNAVGDVDSRSVSFAVGTSPVLLGLLLGGADDGQRRRYLWAAGVVSLLPFVGRLLGRSLTSGGLDSLEGTVTLVTAVLLVVLNVAWGYPLYHLGESVVPTGAGRAVSGE